MGHKVLGESKTGALAVEDCKKLKPDFITMDITMPDMDGITAVKKIRELNIIMVTSHGQEDMVVSSLKAGAKGYILKPVSEEKLAKAIASVDSKYSIDINEDDELLDD